MRRAILLLLCFMFIPLSVNAEGREISVESELKNILDEYIIEGNGLIEDSLEKILQEQYVNSGYLVSGYFEIRKK